MPARWKIKKVLERIKKIVFIWKVLQNNVKKEVEKKICKKAFTDKIKEKN